MSPHAALARLRVRLVYRNLLLLQPLWVEIAVTAVLALCAIGYVIAFTDGSWVESLPIVALIVALGRFLLLYRNPRLRRTALQRGAIWGLGATQR